MAYEKRPEPLTRFDCFMAGISLIAWVILLQILPWANSSLVCEEEILKFKVSSEEDMETFHECIKDNRQMYLFAATALLLGYPIILAHIHYAHRMISTMWSFYNLDLFELIYYGSWFMVATLYCIVLPALFIIVVYYDWEFAEGYEYTGYAIQFQFAHLTLVLSDCIIIPLACTASAPWFSCVASILGINNSSYWVMTDINRSRTIGSMFACKNCGTIVMLFVCFIMGCIPLFGAFATTFEYQKDGFFSYHGDSQWLFIIMFISWITFGISNLYVGGNLENLQNYMNKSVKAVQPIPLSEREAQNNEFDSNPVVPVGPVEPQVPSRVQEDADDADL